MKQAENADCDGVETKDGKWEVNRESSKIEYCRSYGEMIGDSRNQEPKTGEHVLESIEVEL